MAKAFNLNKVSLSICQCGLLSIPHVRITQRSTWGVCYDRGWRKRSILRPSAFPTTDTHIIYEYGQTECASTVNSNESMG